MVLVLSKEPYQEGHATTYHTKSSFSLGLHQQHHFSDKPNTKQTVLPTDKVSDNMEKDIAPIRSYSTLIWSFPICSPSIGGSRWIS
jgi:hypothetical protein